MEHRFLCPLALIHIIDILGESCQVDDAKVRATGWETVWCGFTDIVETCPDVLSTNVGRMFHDIPQLLMGTRPRGMHIVVGRAHIRRIGIGQPPLLRSRIYLVRGHHIVATRLQGTDTLRENEGFAREVLGHVLHPLMMVVETDDINSTALKQMVVGRRFLTACRNGTCSVVAFHDLCQVLRHQTLHAEFTILSQCRGIVASIQNEVSLFQCQRISLSRRPLFQHFVAYRPHEDTGMITIAQHQIAQIALMPLVKETGIVVLCLTTSPHIETLIHHDDSHRVAHIQQFGSWRIM